MGCWFQRAVGNQGWAVLLSPQGQLRRPLKPSPAFTAHTLYTRHGTEGFTYLNSFNSPAKPENYPILQKIILRLIKEPA